MVIVGPPNLEACYLQYDDASPPLDICIKKLPAVCMLCLPRTMNFSTVAVVGVLHVCCLHAHEIHLLGERRRRWDKHELEQTVKCGSVLVVFVSLLICEVVISMWKKLLHFVVVCIVSLHELHQGFGMGLIIAGGAVRGLCPCVQIAGVVCRLCLPRILDAV